MLRAAIDNGYLDYDHMHEDADLDPIRGLQAFGELMEAGYPEGRHAAVWISDPRFEKAACLGLDPEAPTSSGAASWPPRDIGRSRCPDRGQRPTGRRSWPRLARPLVSESAKDELAERQARAAIALVRLGHAGDVWPLLRHGADPGCAASS